MATQEHSDEERLHKMLRLSGVAVKSTYTPKEIAKIFNTTVDSIYRLLRNRELKHFRISGNKGGGSTSKIKVDFLALVDFIATEPDEE